MKKRNMSLILVLALILCLIPATAFADSTTIPTTVSETVTVSGEATIASNTRVTTGKIVVPNGAKLTIKDGAYLWLSDPNGSTNTKLEIEDGGELVVNGKLADLGSDVSLDGKITVNGPNSVVVVKKDNSTIDKVGGNLKCQLKLGENAVATITRTYYGEDGYIYYNYEISSGKATTNSFTNTGDDELVVASGATLDASAGMTLNGTSYEQLTVKNGGKLILPTTDADAKAILDAAYGGEDDLKITSGIYSLDPSKVGETGTSYVANGYNVTPNTEKTEWTVTPAGYLKKIAITLKEPVVGETPATSYKWTVNPDKSANPSFTDATCSTPYVEWVKMSKAKYEDPDNKYKNGWEEVGKNEKFQKDYYYLFYTDFNTINGYEVNSDDITVAINGKDVSDNEVYIYKNGVEIGKVFGPLAEKSPATGDNNELGLFAVTGLISALGVALMLRRKHSM